MLHYLSPIPSWLPGILIALLPYAPAVPSIGPWGEFWGINEEGWASVWATVISTTVAVTVAIFVLRRQNRNLSDVATEDRQHQAEEARIAREIEASVSLKQKLDDYMAAAKAWEEYTMNISEGMPVHLRNPSLPEREKDLKIAMLRWGVSSGLKPKEYQELVAIMRTEATYYVVEESQYLILETVPKVGQHLQTVVDDILLALDERPIAKFAALEKHVAKYEADIKPVINWLKSKYGNQDPYYSD